MKFYKIKNNLIDLSKISLVELETTNYDGQKWVINFFLQEILILSVPYTSEKPAIKELHSIQRFVTGALPTVQLSKAHGS